MVCLCVKGEAIKLLRCSQAHVEARASFSIWAYLGFVGVIDWDVYATGFHHSDGYLWSKTAPSL